MMSNSVISPCIGVCRMNEAANVCAGCFRTRDEIAAWSGMSDEQRRQMMLVLEQRQIDAAVFD